MNAAQIISRALRETNTNAVDYISSVEDLNLVYQDMVNEIIVNTKWDYFWDVGITDLVVYQSEYVAKKLGISPDDLEIKKINKVFVKYSSSDQYPTQLSYQNPSILEYHPDYYKTNQPKSEPFFYIQDNSIFIYPAPTEVVEDWLELYVVHKPADLTGNSTESDIEISPEYHSIMANGMKPYIYQSQGKLNEAQVASQVYDSGIIKMTSSMKQRYNQKQKKTITWLEQFR